MIRSMTGYGKASAEWNNTIITAEIRALNSRYMDLSLKMPFTYKEKEIELRNMISSKLERGKVDVYVNLENSDQSRNQKLNKDLIRQYFNELKELSHELDIKEDLLSVVMRIPNVLATEEMNLDEEEYGIISKVINDAIKNLNKFREREGKELEKDLKLRLNAMMVHLNKIEILEPQRIDRTKERIREQLDNWIGEDKIDKSRFEEEIIYYLEKIDITEEKVRLKTHLDYFFQILEETGHDKGKKLGFITQEIGREINTIGSKANDAEIQKLVVQMKDDLEKVKEQIHNIL